MRKFLFVLLILALSAALVACGGNTANTNTEEPMVEDTAPEEVAESTTPILDRVRERGKVVCGARTDLAGFGYLDADGNNIGFDIDLCRAVAAAVLGDANAIEVVPLSAADRGPALQTAEVDVLILKSSI